MDGHEGMRMDTRNQDSIVSEWETRPAIQFTRLLDNIIDLSKQRLGSDLKSLAEPLRLLTQAVTELKPKVEASEKSRSDFTFDISLYREHKQASDQFDKAKQALKSFEEKNDENKLKLKSDIDKLNEEINLAQGDEALDVIKKLKEKDDELAALHEMQRNQKSEELALERKINGKCCGMRACNKQNYADLLANQNDISETKAKISTLLQVKKEVHGSHSKLQELRSQRDKAQEKLDKLIDGHAVNLKKLKRDVTRAQKIYFKKDKAIKQAKQEYDGMVELFIMQRLVGAYARLLHFSDCSNAKFIELSKGKKSSSFIESKKGANDLYAKLDLLNEEIIKLIKELEDLFKQIQSKEMQNKNGLEIYQKLSNKFIESLKQKNGDYELIIGQINFHMENDQDKVMTITAGH